MMQRRRKWRRGHGLVSIIESFFDFSMQQNTNLRQDLEKKRKIKKSLSGLEDKARHSLSPQILDVFSLFPSPFFNE